MLPLYIFDDICKQLDFMDKDESSGSRLTTLSLVWFLWDVKEPHHCSKRLGDVHHSRVANLSWAGWVICKERS